MRRPIVWSDRAKADYLAILGYIAAENQRAAGRVADRIEETLTILAEFASGRAGRVNGTYEKVVAGTPYILAYEVATLPSGVEAVAILHVIHSARDWPAGRWPSP